MKWFKHYAKFSYVFERFGINGENILLRKIIETHDYNNLSKHLPMCIHTDVFSMSFGCTDLIIGLSLEAVRPVFQRLVIWKNLSI